MSDSSQPHGLYPARLLCPWGSPGKDTGVGCHALLQGIFLTQGSNPSLLCLLHSLSPAPAGKLRSTCLRQELNFITLASLLSLHLPLRAGYQVLHTARGHTFKDIKKEQNACFVGNELWSPLTPSSSKPFSGMAALVEPLQAAGILPRGVQT